MKYNLLGNTGLKVSRLCFGALTIGPLQAGLSLREGAKVVKHAIDRGINFIDTAELYQTYEYIRQGIKGYKNDVVICSKSYAYTYEDMKDSVHRACRELGRDYVDVFMLHEQTSRLTLKGHSDALRYLIDAKKEGLIRAVGVSTHAVEVVSAATIIDDIDVVFPILNMKGIGIIDGNIEQMVSAIQDAYNCGKGIYAMKALGGGHLSSCAIEAFSWVLNKPFIDSVAVGMQSIEEVDFNVALFSGEIPEPFLTDKISKKRRRLIVEEWCTGCGICVEKCPSSAIQIVDNRATLHDDKCVLCGYCGAYCPNFCLKII